MALASFVKFTREVIMKSTILRSEATLGDLDLRTIRQRVAAIKRTWTPEEVSARAAEGRVRRCQLARMVEGLDFGACEDSDAPELSLIG